MSQHDTKPIIHPWLFAIYPVLSTFAVNFQQSRPADLVVPLMVLLTLVWVVRFAAERVFKDRHAAALIVSLLIVFVFSYELFSSLLLRIQVEGFVFKRNMFRMALYVPIAVFAAFVLIRLNTRTHEMTKVFTFVAGMLVSMSFGQIAFAVFRSGQGTLPLHPSRSEPLPANHSKDNALGLPDIYYIILDGYAREDVLRDVFHYDNSQFILTLKKRGFYIPAQARSNYAITNLSMPSSANMNYIDPGTAYSEPDNVVQHILEGKGYRYYYLSSAAGTATAGRTLVSYNIVANEFTLLLMRRTVLDAIASRFNLYAFFMRRAVLGDFDRICAITTQPERKFVFAHIMSPHPPYIFGPNGESVKPAPLSISMNILKTPWDNKDAYVAQLRFINKKVLEVIDCIQRNSSRPPVIVVQSDHGPHLSVDRDNEARICMRILNAYHLPDGGNAHLYDTITPVNTFRYIFNYYFKFGVPLLPDKCYYSTFSMPRIFEDASDLISTAITLKGDENK